MHKVPPSPDTYGKTEAIIGDWLSRNPKRRQELIIASKIAGPDCLARNGGPITGEAVIDAVDASIKRFANRLHRSVPTLLAKSHHPSLR